jgi:A/G-specific adenine glycosylase
MSKSTISKKILFWYDNNKRILPWRKSTSREQKLYFTLVSEFMLQQTQVSTVIPYFKRFVQKIPNFKKLSKTNDQTLMKLWEGLGYYSRARNLKKSAIMIINKFGGILPSNFEDLKSLPGVGDYTSTAVMAIAFNEKFIPLDGNIERILKRVLFLRSDKDISKENMKISKNFFGSSERASDYAQAIMELGALVCRPVSPLCGKCPISINCISYKRKDFSLIKKTKKNKIKYFEVNIYMNENKLLLVRNNKFNFLKNLLIFPMNEIDKSKFNSSPKVKTKIKISNIDMNIVINKNKIKSTNKGIILNRNNIASEVIPSFTKKLLRVASSNV